MEKYFIGKFAVGKITSRKNICLEIVPSKKITLEPYFVGVVLVLKFTRLKTNASKRIFSEPCFVGKIFHRNRHSFATIYFVYFFTFPEKLFSDKIIFRQNVFRKKNGLQTVSDHIWFVENVVPNESLRIITNSNNNYMKIRFRQNNFSLKYVSHITRSSRSVLSKKRCSSEVCSSNKIRFQQTISPEKYDSKQIFPDLILNLILRACLFFRVNFDLISEVA